MVDINTNKCNAGFKPKSTVVASGDSIALSTKERESSGSALDFMESEERKLLFSSTLTKNQGLALFLRSIVEIEYDRADHRDMFNFLSKCKFRLS